MGIMYFQSMLSTAVGCFSNTMWGKTNKTKQITKQNTIKKKKKEAWIKNWLDGQKI